MPNAPGTIDPGYRGEIRVILLNLGREPYTVHAGDRIAQMIVARYEAVEWEEGELADSGARRGRVRLVGKMTGATGAAPACGPGR